MKGTRYQYYLLCGLVDVHGVNIVLVPGPELEALSPVLQPELGPALQQVLVQHHPHHAHRARVHQADACPRPQQEQRINIKTGDIRSDPDPGTGTENQQNLPKGRVSLLPADAQKSKTKCTGQIVLQVVLDFFTDL